MLCMHDVNYTIAKKVYITINDHAFNFTQFQITVSIQSGAWSLHMRA